tara:strand:- start:4810 stop:5508 length:699 start_codon:yes stop_codon:yes gene_type:complete
MKITPILMSKLMITRFTRNLLVGLSISFIAVFGTADAQSVKIPFDQNWKEQGFMRLFSNEYDLQDQQLDIISDGTVSVLWRPVDAAQERTKQASWDWSVTKGVGPTDLTARGGDDRNLAMYFVFVDPETAQQLNRTSARKLLSNPKAKALIYVWGGIHPNGSLLPSPYAPGLKTKILRTVETGNFSETVNIDQDFVAAFGNTPKTLVGLAVSADSDDTDGFISGSIRDLSLQ